ncbi:hypothetical protein [Crocinitomix catalasitica]|uniref:hypothetical protein n=1 Tax=Crocinitomix catalasitica TaxID=184607 RepID=UPI00048485BE|nr:hypothetical protein [Crocinitomix catalasitica]
MKVIMLQRIRNSYITKGVSVLMAFNLIGEIIFPTIVFGLTSGPIDINQASFEPASTSEMVNLATGDFTYNIPLMDVDGYPINIAYHGGVSMEQEASIVGLGWTLNVGAMNRMKRGLPDDFNGDDIVTEMNLRPKTNTGGSIGASVELVGFENVKDKDKAVVPSFSHDIGVSFNNYTGYSLNVGMGAGLSIGKKESLTTLGLGIGLESSTENGMSVSPSANLSIGKPGESNMNASIGIGFTMNTAQGLQNVNLNAGIGVSDADGAGMGMSSSTSLPISTVTYTPSVSFEKNVTINNFDFDLGLELATVYPHAVGKFFKTSTCIKSNVQTSDGYGYLYEQNKSETENYLLDFNRDGFIIPNENIAYLPIVNHTFDVYSASAQGVGFSSRPFRSDVLIVSEAQKADKIDGFGFSGEFGYMYPLSFEFGVNLNFSTGFTESGKWKEDNEIVNEFIAKPSPGLLYENTYFKKLGNRSGSSTSFYNSLVGKFPLRQKILERGRDHIGLASFISDVDTDLSIEESAVHAEKAFTGAGHYREIRDFRNTNIEYLTAREATNHGLNSIDNHTLNNFTYTGGQFSSVALTRYGSLQTEAKQHHMSEMNVLKGDGSRYVYGIPVVNHFTDEVLFNVSNKYPFRNAELESEKGNLNSISTQDDEYGVNFNVDDLTPNCEEGVISYQAVEEDNAYADNSTNNRRGDNNLYVKKRLPASANSHLLTAFLSSNYIDRTGDGPSPDDFGGYTKFNYSKMSEPTKWRFPFEENKAAFNEGLKANEYDDMGTYVYGEREQWYTHSIESKNFVAVFNYGDRHDGYGVADENGGRAAINNAKRLISISLYTRHGLANDEAPIKTVHFEYDYLLCQNVPNNDGLSLGDETGVYANQGGKLTLKSIYFTYGNAERGKLHKYTFEYDLLNPNYKLGEADRWGSYLENSTAGCDVDDPLSNFEYPYAKQDKDVANTNSSAWTLKSINLPSGSKIEIEIEADDYSYVMEKKASKMYKLKGFSKSSGFEGTNVLYDDIGENRFMHVALDDPIIATETDALKIFKRDFIGDLKEIYFKCLVSVSPKVGAEDKYEYVMGYAEIDVSSISVRDDDDDLEYEIAVVPLRAVHIKDEEKTPEGGKSTNPITKASWQFMRKYLPNAINPIVGDIFTNKDGIPYGYNCGDLPEIPDFDKDDPKPSEESEEEGDGLRDIFNVGKSQFQNIISLGGYNSMLKSMGFASKLKPAKSWVRLYQGQVGEKLGGGHRVASIKVNDNWADVKAIENSSQYGTKYSYNLVEDLDEGYRIISSGVASYEPISAGADENSYRNPTKYTIDVKFRANDNEYQEKPLGEKIFGTSRVVYALVEVENITYDGVNQNASGKTVHEFYTAKDFPSFVDHTNRANNTKVKTKNNPLAALFTGDSFYHLSMSQGYSVQINDMHGKFKSKKVYSAPLVGEIDLPGIYSTSNQLYSLIHKYYTEDHQSNVLLNKMPVVNEEGAISEKFIGKDIDMVVDLHQTRSYHSSIATQFGLEVNGPVPIPSFWMSGPTQDNRFRSSVTTKVIYSNGILKEIVLNDNGRLKSTKNLLFDEKTGVPVVTEIRHEAGKQSKPIYQYDYPAYWMYKGMGMASENWGAKFQDIIDLSTSRVTLASFEDFLNPGDEIAVYDLAEGYKSKCWILKNEGTGDYYLIDRFGDVATENILESGHSYEYKVIRSGKRNLLGSTAASVTSMHLGLNDDETPKLDPYNSTYEHTEILNASAVKYTERAFGYKSTLSIDNGPGPYDGHDLCGLAILQKTNPYVQGLLANWNLLETFVFDGERDQTLGRIREDGTLIDYIPFWKNTDGTWGINSNQEIFNKWLLAAQATIFDREGYNLESKDAIGIYSSILLGYNKTLKVAEAVNSRYYEIGFDGFEDRDYDVDGDCTNPHFRFDTETSEIVTNPKFAHSGRKSLKIPSMSQSAYSGHRINTITNGATDHGIPYVVQKEELIPGHHFIVGTDEGKRYVLTAWAKETKNETQVTSYDGAAIDFLGFTPSDIVENRSNIIDGWQRIEVEFTVPGGDLDPAGVAANILLKNTGLNDVYFDDVRVQPYNSEMVSYVIDPLTLRLWATLDSRNFATFYQYDEEGSLVRIIQETERGRVTVQENRAGIRIQN